MEMNQNHSRHISAEDVDVCASAVAMCSLERFEGEMYRIGAFATDMLNSIDNVAKETLEGRPFLCDDYFMSYWSCRAKRIIYSD